MKIHIPLNNFSYPECDIRGVCIDVYTEDTGKSIRMSAALEGRFADIITDRESIVLLRDKLTELLDTLP